MLICSGIGFYWYLQIAERIPASEASLRKMQNSIQSIDCPSLNKEVVISNKRELVEQGKRIGDLFLLMGGLFLMVGIINLILVLEHFKQTREVPINS
jgi:hypothetical protein